MGAVLSRESGTLSPAVQSERVRAISEAQSLIQDAMDIASTLRILVVSTQQRGHAVYDLVVYDQHDLPVGNLCESALDNFSMAYAAVRRLQELLNAGDPQTLAELLDHVDTHYAGVSD